MPNNSHYNINVTHNLNATTVAIEITSEGVTNIKEFQQIKKQILAVFSEERKISLNDNKFLSFEIHEKNLLEPSVRQNFDNIMRSLLEEDKLHFNTRSAVNAHLNAIANNYIDEQISKYKMEL